MLRATRDPARGPTRRHRQIEREDAIPPAVLRAGFDVQSLTAGTSDPVRMATRVARESYTARRPFNPPERVSGPGQDAQLRIDPSLPSRTIAMS